MLLWTLGIFVPTVQFLVAYVRLYKVLGTIKIYLLSKFVKNTLTNFYHWMENLYVRPR